VVPSAEELEFGMSAAHMRCHAPAKISKAHVNSHY